MVNQRLETRANGTSFSHAIVTLVEHVSLSVQHAAARDLDLKTSRTGVTSAFRTVATFSPCRSMVIVLRRLTLRSLTRASSSPSGVSITNVLRRRSALPST